MPVQWTNAAEAPGRPGAFLHDAGAPPAFEARLWPHRSLSRHGFVTFIGITCGLVALPLLGVLGTPVLWGLLPFFMATIGGLWLAFQRNYGDARLTEVLRLWQDHVEICRQNPHGPEQHWEANPYWVRLNLRAEGGPVENYLTLAGGGREVELGAFLSPEERAELHDRLGRALAGLR